MSIVEPELTLDQLLQEREWRKCFPNTRDPAALHQAFTYFCRQYVNIKHPEYGRMKFDLYDAQAETANNWLRHRYTLILKARQLGFSTLVAVYCLWLTFGYQDRVIIMLSKTERDAIKLLGKAKYAYRFLPEWMIMRGPPMNATQTKMEFANESYIESLPSASDPARGESVYLAVVDELAYLPNSEEAWASIEPIADVGGRVITLSTAKGEGNLFHTLWVGATTKTNRFKPMFYPWYANGRDREWYNDKKIDLPEWQMAQEYPEDPEEAFLKSGNPVFDVEMLRRLAAEAKPPVAEGYHAKHRGWAFVHQEGEPLRVWEEPDEDCKYVIGADPAQGYEHGDFTSVHAINARTGVVCAHWHGRIDPDLLGSDVLAPLGWWYNSALIAVESNNHGLSVLKALQKVKYHPIYMQRSPKYKKSVPTDVLGWRTSQVTKPLAIDELNMALREGDLTLWDADTISEMRTFVRDGNGKMHGSPFDDRTISLAIANQMLKYVFLNQYTPEEEPGPGTFGYMEKLMYGDDVLRTINPGWRKVHVRKPIGSFAVRAPRVLRGRS